MCHPVQKSSFLSSPGSKFINTWDGVRKTTSKPWERIKGFTMFLNSFQTFFLIWGLFPSPSLELMHHLQLAVPTPVKVSPLKKNICWLSALLF
jgi:hypothetical protein